MIRLILKPTVLTISIFAMAGVYYTMWEARPDYFRVQSGVNILPLDLVQIARQYSEYSDKKPLPDWQRQEGKIEAATKRIEEIYHQFHLATVSLANKQSEYAARQQQDALDYKPFADLQWSQYDQFIARKTAPFAAHINAIKDSLKSILTTSGVSDPGMLPVGPRTKYFNLNVDLARAELQKAKAEVDAREYGMRHLTDFQQQPSQKGYIARTKEIEDLRRSISDEQSSTNKLHGDLYDAFLDYRTAMSSHLRYWDFLYFSVGAATTATFGDISPNSTLVRILVCLQVLCSIIFTGLMVNEWASRPQRRDSESSLKG